MNDPDNTKAKEGWLTFALEVLLEQGPESIKIGPLCDLKGVTKGSFYHHFKNRSVFVSELMEFWFHKMTLDFIAQANTEATPLERLEKLDQVIAQNHSGVETHIRAWALKEPIIKEYLAKIDNTRQQYLADCYIGMGLDTELANDVALMAYANFLGMQQIHPTPPIETVLRVTVLSSKTFLEKAQ